jgi:hypothetical protein
MKKKLLLFVTLAATAMVVGATVGYASGSAVHSRSKSSESVSALIASQSTGGGCRMGYDTQTSTLTPPDDSTADNVPAASVTITKPCRGAVVGQFQSEVSTSTAGAFIHIDMRATCTGKGGFTNACTVGMQVFGSPGHTFLQNVQAGVQTHGVNMVWTGLPKGIWRFDVLPGGGQGGNLQFRTFHVEAFAGG